MKNNHIQILLIEDEKPEIYARKLESEKFSVIVARNGSEGISKFKEFQVDAVFLDLRLPDLPGRKILKQIREIDPLLPIFVITAYADIESAVSSLKNGAVEFLAKGNIDWENVTNLIRNYVKKRKIEIEAAKHQELIKTEKAATPFTIIGQSYKIREVLALLSLIGEQEVTVLIQGESGTGKELVARTLHYQSSRRNNPFLAINCAAIPENLLEAELFGYERGAFTHAVESHPGKFEIASDGTIFLDEIGDMSLAAQSKILRVLEQREFERLGSTRTIKTNARIIAATSKNLEESVKNRSFREELYFRLNVVNIYLPPLRERKEDIPLLCEYALKKFNATYKKNVTQISPDTMAYLIKYHWPGNVRELFHIIERGVILSQDETLTLEVLPEKLKNAELSLPENGVLDLDNVTKSHITRILKITAGNRSKAARILGIDRKRLARLIKKYGLQSLV